MKRYQGILAVAFALFALVSFEACSPAKGDHPGSEYMPDMGHSIAYEANTYGYYYQNTWDSDSENDANSGFSRKQLTLHNLPPEGTVARGFAGVINTKTGKEYMAKMEELNGETTTNAIAVPVNGQVPYYLPNTEEGRQAAYASAELSKNPYPISEKGLEKGKELYDIYCGICHGKKGDGAGWLYDEEQNSNAKYPAAPTNYLTDEMVNAQNGRYYHAIMHGKGVMGAYKDKLSYEERWQVIHYIRSLQAKDRKLAYSPYENTLNSTSTPITDSDFPVDLSNSKINAGFDAAAKNHTSLVLEGVTFATGSANLTPKSKQELNELTEILNQNPSAKIELAGYTDNVGDPANNQALSQARAESVKAYLVGKGIASERMTAAGYGEANPRADNRTESGKQKNRRTEFKVL